MVWHVATTDWPMTGRHSELAAAAAALQSDESQGVLLIGAAGAGSSRLAAEVDTAAARQGHRVLRIAATEVGRSVPLGAFAYRSPSSGRPDLDAHGVISAFAAPADAPATLLSIDDAHLLDDTSAFVLHQLVHRRLAKAVITLRPGRGNSDAVLKLWKDGLLRRIDVAPLSRHESDLLVTRALGGPLTDDCALRLWELTRGNVSFLTQLVRQEIERHGLVRDDGRWGLTAEPGMSPALGDVVAHHIGPVPEPLRDVLEIVSVARTIDRRHLYRLADPDAAADAERRGLICAEPALPDMIRMTHPMYSRWVLARCGPVRLRRLRGRVATEWAHPGTPEPVDPVALGVLWLQSDLEPSPLVLTDAADAALKRLDLPVAEQCARAAADAGGGLTPRLLHAQSLTLLGRTAEALDRIREVNPDHVDGLDLRRWSELRALMSICPTTGSRSVPPGRCADTDEADAFRGMQQVSTGNPDGAIATTNGIDVRRLGALGRTAYLSGRALAFTERGDLAQAEDNIEMGRHLLESSEDALAVVVASKLHSTALILSGFLGRAAAVAEHARSMCADMGTVAQRLCAAVHGIVALARGDLPTALRELDEPNLQLATSVATHHSARDARIAFAIAAARSARIADAVAALESIRQATPPSLIADNPDYLIAQAWSTAGRGHPGAAQRTAVRAADRARTNGQRAREILCLQTAVQLGATGLATRLAEVGAVVPGPRSDAAARYAAALDAGSGCELDSVSDEFEALGDLLTAADAAGHASAAHRAAAHRDRTLAAAARAQRLAALCGGATGPAIDNAKVDAPFTDRQRDIARLVLDGLSNREIADVLSLSTRTVEGHIYRASFKAGVASRIELAKLIIQFDQVDV